MFITNEQIHNELQEVKGMISQLLCKQIDDNIKEISLAGLSKAWNKSPETIKRYYREEGLKGRVVDNKKAKDGTSLVFKVSDVLEFQKTQQQITQKVEPAPVSIVDLAKREIKRVQESK